MVSIPNIKCCLSNRPHKSFSNAFGAFHMLKLQDLTRSDIEEYVSASLDELLWSRAVLADQPDWAFNPKELIVKKVEGVILRVKLATKDQITGTNNDDSLEVLEDMLWILPNEVEGLYAHMLGRSEKAYQKESAGYL